MSHTISTTHVSGEMLAKAKNIVVDYFNRHVDKTDNFLINEEQVYIVWFNKTLQHWKALLSTTVPDGMYYELTYNGDKKETYVDAYRKINNERVTDVDYEASIVRGLY